MRPRHFFFALILAVACGDSKPSTESGVAHAESPAKSGAPAPRREPRGPEHAVFSLVDNRLLAHAQRGGGLVAHPGAPGFAKYLHFQKSTGGWKPEKIDGRAAARVSGKVVDLEVPLTQKQAEAARVYVRVLGATGMKMEAKLNGTTLGTQNLAEGWQTITYEAKANAARGGENRVQIFFNKGGAAAVHWIQVAGEAPSTDPSPIYDAPKKALILPKGGGLAYYVFVPDKGRLVGDVDGAGCKIAITATPHDGGSIAGTLEGVGSSVDLSKLSGSVVRLELAPEGCAEARLASAALAVPGAAPTVKRDAKPKYIVFWIMDSLRADRVKPFFPKARADVPEFEKLAKEGSIFVNTYVQGNESRASHASIWTSLYVVNHRMIPSGVKVLESKWTTLGEAMKSAKFFTSGVSANGYIVKKWGFGDGWDAYRNHIHDGGGVAGENIWDKARASVEGKTKSPFFLYLGTIDTHVSWRAKEPWISKYSPKYNGKYKKEASGTDVEKMATGKLKITDEDKQHIIAIYDSNVSYQDELLGKVRKQLADWGIADDTMIVITADHGDEQWEAGRVGHGGSLAESLIRVPLAIYYPPLFPAGSIEEGADTIDILPTLLDAVGMGPPEESQGESLIPLAQGVGRGYPRPSIASQYENWHAMRLAGWKIKAGGDKMFLYHIANDPYEKTELQNKRPLERRFVTDALATFLIHQSKWKKSRWGVASNHSPHFAADLER